MCVCVCVCVCVYVCVCVCGLKFSLKSNIEITENRKLNVSKHLYECI